MKRMINNNLFLESCLTETNPFISTQEILSWIGEQNKRINVDIEKVNFSDLDSWSFDTEKTILKHDSGKFFSIQGINVVTNWGDVQNWSQPIIAQPEIGYLGVIVKEFDGVLYFLLQAKVEPGNVNNVQLSPTLQATKSNYSKVHKGRAPLYLDYFTNAKQSDILLDQLQSEQGARFLKKRNRNIIIKTEHDIEMYENFIWLTLGQIKELLSYDNIVNMDTRTVISGIPIEVDNNSFTNLKSKFNQSTRSYKMLLSASNEQFSLRSFDEIITWFTALKCKYELDVSTIPLHKIKDWVITKSTIEHKDRKYFSVIGAKVKISNREVQQWSQPLVEPHQAGIVAFIIKEINGIYHFLVQAKLECGNFDILEFAPTVQCITGSYSNIDKVPFLSYVLNAKETQIIHKSLQSEEGGRFFREQNRNIIIEADEKFSLDVPENYQWITLNQLNMFLKFNNYLNIQARSLLSVIKFK
jgi:dTDP-4-dehydro-6-deoxy-alpha-D-glucopyranose 2,3-dehydratase